MANSNLNDAKKAKQDEFYTQWADIEKEMQAYLEYGPDVFRGKVVLLPCDDPEWSNFTKYFALNFDSLGIKKLISTSYAPCRKGRIYVTEQSVNLNREYLKWDYLQGDGDFRSDEIKALRDEADIVITNPPFSLFREFMAWLVEGDVEFSVIGNMNAITYKEVFPLIKDNKAWLGATNFNNGMFFRVPEDFAYKESYKFKKEENGMKVSRVPGVCWFTNIHHGRRHDPLPLMAMEDNLRFNKRIMGNPSSYKTYDNYDAIEVPFTAGIPSDYEGVMGVPISFLDKYSPEQFEILGATESEGKGFSQGLWDEASGTAQAVANGVRKYKRIFIKHKPDWEHDNER